MYCSVYAALSQDEVARYTDIFMPFPTAMSGHPYIHAQEACRQKNEWQLIEELYMEHLVNHFVCDEQPRIPKIVHHIWLGSPLPEKCRVLRETWIENHPDWEFMLWTDDDLEKFGLENKVLYDATSNYGERSDIARYEIVHRYGGMYVDTDFESIKPLDILHHSLDFYTGIYISSGKRNAPSVVMGNGIIAACPGHPILRAAIDGMKHNPASKGNTSSILSRTGPYYWTRIVLGQAGKHGLKDVVLPPMFVYPMPISGRGQTKEQQKKFLSPSTFANHHWHMSWINRGGNRSKKK